MKHPFGKGKGVLVQLNQDPTNKQTRTAHLTLPLTQECTSFIIHLLDIIGAHIVIWGHFW
jgi:hypothetical protein